MKLLVTRLAACFALAGIAIGMWAFTLEREAPMPKMKYLPEDMVLVKADSQSFYISNHYTTNREYMLYLLWLRNVYVDYPNVLQASLPDSSSWKSNQFNEPHMQQYLFHPAFEEYPVLGVSWLQADAFCRWKTHRLNEHVLLKESFFMHPSENSYIQINENNFNTEAWICGQYEGMVNYDKFGFPFLTHYGLGGLHKSKSIDSAFKILAKQHESVGAFYLNGSFVQLYDMAENYIFSHFRLPTETELELAYRQDIKMKKQSSEFINGYSKLSEFHLPRFKMSGYGIEPLSLKRDYWNGPTDSVFLPYSFTYSKDAAYPAVQYEWAFDVYQEIKNNPYMRLLDVYAQAAQPQGGIRCYSDYYGMAEKDSLGCMFSFYILKEENGFAIPVKNYQPNGVYKQRVVKSKTSREARQEQYGYGNTGFRVAMCTQ